MNDGKIERFYLLDIARGLASLSVVIWHFQAFYYPPGSFLPDSSFVRADQPFYNIFNIFYEYGYMAVQFFFVLSGFIFFWLYGTGIAKGNESPRSFFILRFSRLYPLHLLTLLIVAILQFYSNESLGYYLLHPTNDLKHFFLNTLLIHHWGFQHWLSFNAPSWSISVEIFAYIVFFVSMKLLGTKVWQLSIIVLAAIALSQFNSALGQVTLFFFLGCITYSVFEFFSRQRGYYSLSAGFICALIFFVLEQVVAVNTLVKASFPFVVLFLALIQFYLRTFGKSFTLIGDLTYSTYLLHLPLQLILLLLVQHGFLDDSFHEVFFIGYMVILLCLSYFCFHYFERPAQTYIRRKLLKK